LAVGVVLAVGSACFSTCFYGGDFAERLAKRLVTGRVGKKRSSERLFWRDVFGLVGEVESVLVLGDDVGETMTELGLFETKDTLVDLFLKNLAGVSVLHQFAHSGREETLVIERVSAILWLTTLTLLSFLRLLIFASKLWVVKLRIESLFDHLHALHERRWVALFDYRDEVVVEVDLLSSFLLAAQSSSSSRWSSGCRVGDVVRVENAKSPVGSLALVERVLTAFDFLDDFLSFGGHFASMFEIGSEAFDDREDVLRFPNGYIRLVFRSIVSSEFFIVLK
jgi:hypothetical protein